MSVETYIVLVSITECIHLIVTTTTKRLNNPSTHYFPEIFEVLVMLETDQGHYDQSMKAVCFSIYKKIYKKI